MSDQIILDMTTPEIVACYNQLSKIEVKKFKDRKTAEMRLHGLAHLDTKKFVKAMKSAKVRKDLIAKYERELEEEAKKAEDNAKKQQEQAAERQKAADLAATKKKDDKKRPVAKPAATIPALDRPGGMEDPDFAAAAKVLLDAQSKLKGKELEAAQKVVAHRSKPQRGLPTELAHESVAAKILWFIQFLIKQKKIKHEDLVTTSAEVAQAAITTGPHACSQIDILVHLGCVTIEDDTTDQSDPFYYVTLTDKGAAFQLGDEKPEIKPERGAKAAREPREPRAAGAPRAPKADKAGKCIYKKVKENPRREGSIGWKSWNLIVDGMTYEDYLKAGGRAGDCAWDLEHGFIELR